jgi:hypothetical protein
MQPRADTLVASEFGAPRAFFMGFDPARVAADYGCEHGLPRAALCYQGGVG